MRCLIVDEMHISLIPMLSAIGVEGEYKPKITKEAVLDNISQYEGIIVRSKLRLDKAFFNKATKLQWIGRAGAGLDNIDLAQAMAAGVQIFNAPEGNRDAVAEHTVALMLALLNNICQANEQVRTQQWEREANRGYELSAQTVGLIGYGNMGQATASRLQGFGCRVIAYDKYIKEWPDTNATRVTFEQLQTDADIVSLHIPLTYETRSWVNARFIAGFSKPFWLINTARGEVVQLIDLLYYIKNGHIRGAALDVLENEKMDQLLTLERVVLDALNVSQKVIYSPHVAGWTHQSYVRINEVLVRKIDQAINGLAKG